MTKPNPGPGGTRVAATLAAITMTIAPQAALATPPTLSDAQSIALGKQLTTRNCAMCHSVGAKGLSPNPKAPAFRDLNERLDVEALGEGLATGILTRHPAMPEFRFEPYEVVAIVRYLRSIQGRQSAEAPQPSAAGATLP